VIESPRVPQERFARNGDTPRLLYFFKGFRAVTMGYIFLSLTATLLFRARIRYTFFSMPDSKCAFFVFAACYTNVAVATGYVFTRVCGCVFHVFSRVPLIVFSRAFCFGF